MRNIYDLPSFLGIVPDGLGNLRSLRVISIANSHIINITDQLGFLRNLVELYLDNCNITNLPDLSGISSLSYASFTNNQLSKVNGLTGVYFMDLDSNSFTEVPIVKNSGNLYSLRMSNNPIKNMLSITSYTSLQFLYLANTNISSIPHTIDKLQKLEYLYMNNNKLFFLPTNLLNLPELRTLYVENNLFSSSDKQTFQSRFNQSNPNVTLYI